ncbi:unnamed protein product [Peniophora sp. CBMAI 1063]|nr:unnamed protein product [Peniophora sp. CBMAI 1063]
MTVYSLTLLCKGDALVPLLLGYFEILDQDQRALVLTGRCLHAMQALAVTTKIQLLKEGRYLLRLEVKLLQATAPVGLVAIESRRSFIAFADFVEMLVSDGEPLEHHPRLWKEAFSEFQHHFVRWEQGWALWQAKMGSVQVDWWSVLVDPCNFSNEPGPRSIIDEPMDAALSSSTADTGATASQKAQTPSQHPLGAHGHTTHPTPRGSVQVESDLDVGDASRASPARYPFVVEDPQATPDDSHPLGKDNIDVSTVNQSNKDGLKTASATQPTGGALPSGTSTQDKQDVPGPHATAPRTRDHIPGKAEGTQRVMHADEGQLGSTEELEGVRRSQGSAQPSSGPERPLAPTSAEDATSTTAPPLDMSSAQTPFALHTHGNASQTPAPLSHVDDAFIALVASRIDASMAARLQSLTALYDQRLDSLITWVDQHYAGLYDELYQEMARREQSTIYSVRRYIDTVSVGTNTALATLQSSVARLEDQLQDQLKERTSTTYTPGSFRTFNRLSGGPITPFTTMSSRAQLPTYPGPSSEPAAEQTAEMPPAETQDLPGSASSSRHPVATTFFSHTPRAPIGNAIPPFSQSAFGAMPSGESRPGMKRGFNSTMAGSEDAAAKRRRGTGTDAPDG